MIQKGFDEQDENGQLEAYLRHNFKLMYDKEIERTLKVEIFYKLHTNKTY